MENLLILNKTDSDKNVVIAGADVFTNQGEDYGITIDDTFNKGGTRTALHLSKEIEPTKSLKPRDISQIEMEGVFAIEIDGELVPFAFDADSLASYFREGSEQKIIFEKVGSSWVPGLIGMRVTATPDGTAIYREISVEDGSSLQKLVPHSLNPGEWEVAETLNLDKIKLPRGPVSVVTVSPTGRFVLMSDGDTPDRPNIYSILDTLSGDNYTLDATENYSINNALFVGEDDSKLVIVDHHNQALILTIDEVTKKFTNGVGVSAENDDFSYMGAWVDLEKRELIVPSLFSNGTIRNAELGVWELDENGALLTGNQLPVDGYFATNVTPIGGSFLGSALINLGENGWLMNHYEDLIQIKVDHTTKEVDTVKLNTGAVNNVTKLRTNSATEIELYVMYGNSQYGILKLNPVTGAITEHKAPTALGFFGIQGNTATHQVGEGKIVQTSYNPDDDNINITRICEFAVDGTMTLANIDLGVST